MSGQVGEIEDEVGEDEDQYVIWSNEHQGWWLADGQGYTRRLSQAGHYSRQRAIEISTKAIPGTAARMHALPEIPVRLVDVVEMLIRHEAQFGKRDEGWQ